MKIGLKRRKTLTFICEYCHRQVQDTRFIGTAHRNHCPYCLWSEHADLEKSGDRKSTCWGMMEPVGLTFKKEGVDKWEKPRQGELMLIHQCQKCGKVSINRIAGDDEVKKIWNIFESSLQLGDEFLNRLKKQGIEPLSNQKDEQEIRNQLFGKLD